ncbi:peroxisomal membrane protein 4 [Angomonas deanei]|uniref:Tim17/Tim22/Tim23/Pmp24 family, putative n=1 Tax=Angomonas deanei TaxID=59799 RepID=S9UUR6_9TRYP|nr:peroxisomal membrane protein 4 [Angomonas deanei]EPY32623.1 peroxisomal membrane protein 4 [Angomonas deanei]EPY38426.1 peroxisomal membrane protein 4 [Angomonas deanei]CAD2221334.1 Tim17/Tim22/Tim23/Pmp24 family, putative [Angomonas deanei]|eukprot:EPY24813.1 peroxisomal membrane protein 4 [Angomonas deanei]
MSDHNIVLTKVNEMIQSGDFDILFSAVKAFRNGVVYGTRVRAPHALVLNLVWSKAPYSTLPRRIFNVTKTHALGLGCSGILFTVVRLILKYLQGESKMWHHALAGFLIGISFWGDVNSPVHQQMMMYLLARNVCSLFQLAVEKCRVNVPSWGYRAYMGMLWAIVLVFFMHRPDLQQSSLRQSLQYIYLDSSKFSNWYDVFVMNTAGSL